MKRKLRKVKQQSLLMRPEEAALTSALLIRNNAKFFVGCARRKGNVEIICKNFELLTHCFERAAQAVQNEFRGIRL